MMTATNKFLRPFNPSARVPVEAPIPAADTSAAALAAAAAAAAEEEESEEDKKKREDDEKEEARAKKAEEDEADKKKKEEDEEKANAAAGSDAMTARAAERERIRAILDAGDKAGRPKFARKLALAGDLSASIAVAMLEGADEDKPRQTGSALSDRMAVTPTPAIGGGDAGPAVDTPQSRAAAIIAAGKKRRGEV